MLRPLAAASALALMTLAACDPLGNYKGEPRAELTVTLTDADDDVPSRPLHLGVSWFHNTDEADEVEDDVERLEVLPATPIKLRIYKEPPLTALYEGAPSTELQLGVGMVAVLDAEQSLEVGFDQDHVVIYVPREVPAGSFAARMLSGTPPPGFHIYRRRELMAAEAEQRSSCFYDELQSPRTWEAIFDRCGWHPEFQEIRPVPTNLATPLSIELVEFISMPPPPLLWSWIDEPPMRATRPADP